MKFMIKLMLIIGLGAFGMQACNQKPQPISTPDEIATAVRKNDTKAISQWIENGGDVNQKVNGTYLLYFATGPKSGRKMVELLLKNGAEVNVGNYTPLMNAAGWLKVDIVKLLLEHGADESRVNEHGENAKDLIGDCNGCASEIKLKSMLKNS